MVGYRRRFRPWLLRPWAIVLLLMLAAAIARQWPRTRIDRMRVPVDGEVVRVLRAVDGDTLLLVDGRRVRLLGIDTPETKHPDRPAQPFGSEASAFVASLVDGKSVSLEYDRERLDDYGRWLAYVFINDELLNERLILEGFSEAENAFPFRSDMKRRFEKAQEQARSASRGIWSLQSN